MFRASFVSAWLTLGFFLVSDTSQAAVIQFDILGKAGPGLLAGNENQAVNGAFGSGGEIGAGIFFDDDTNLLTINVGWGTGNGFTSLTGNATAMHIHQSASFTTNGGIVVGLDNLGSPVPYNSNATNGGFTGTVTLTNTLETALLSGLLYLNVHTTTNGSGEIRGNLVAVPEPSSVALLSLMALPLVISGYRSRRRALVG